MKIKSPQKWRIITSFTIILDIAVILITYWSFMRAVMLQNGGSYMIVLVEPELRVIEPLIFTAVFIWLIIGNFLILYRERLMGSHALVAYYEQLSKNV